MGNDRQGVNIMQTVEQNLKVKNRKKKKLAFKRAKIIIELLLCIPLNECSASLLYDSLYQIDALLRET